MSTSEGSFSFSDESVEVQQTKNYGDKKANVFRPEAGKTYRIHFVSEEVEMRKRHYNPLKKRYFRCLAYQGFCPACLAASNKVNNIKGASDTFGANILIYDTDDSGSAKQPLNAEVAFWAFGSDKFVQLRNITKEWGPASTLDLMVTCTDAQFQKVQISPARNCLYSSDPTFKAACDQKIKEDSYPLEKFLCKEIPVVQMAQEFGLGDEYVPESFRQQMGIGAPTPQDAAMGYQAPQAQPSTPPWEAQASQPVQQAPQAQPAFTPPTPPENQFADIADITKLL